MAVIPLLSPTAAKVPGRQYVSTVLVEGDRAPSREEEAQRR